MPAASDLEQVKEVLAPTEVPHLDEIMSALWLRSLAVEKLAGAEPATIHADITRNTALDDNFFQVELRKVADNSFNIHEIGTRFVFLEPENQRAKLMSFSRNDKLFTGGEDLTQLALEMRYVIGGAGDAPNKFRVIVLRGDWLKKPWDDLDPAEHPDQWDDRIPILILPEADGAAVMGRVVNAVRDTYPAGIGKEVVIVDQNGRAVPFGAGVFEVADHFAFFAIDTDDRQTLALEASP